MRKLNLTVEQSKQLALELRDILNKSIPYFSEKDDHFGTPEVYKAIAAGIVSRIKGNFAQEVSLYIGSHRRPEKVEFNYIKADVEDDGEPMSWNDFIESANMAAKLSEFID